MSKDDDLKMLDVLLGYETLDEWEKEAFSGMKERLAHSDKALTKLQREKVEKAWKRLGLDLDADKGSKNLWSSGKVPLGKPLEFPYNLTRPLKPPGRS
jgi:hypothetical protein